MFIRGNFRPPHLRFFTDDAPGGGAGGEEAKPSDTPKFPADTPVKDMTAEQQAAYWQDKARKHEDRVKKYGDVTPEKLAQLQREHAELVSKGQTAEEQAVEAAREEGRKEILAVLNKERATTALQNALNGRVPDAAALLGLDVTTFVVDGKVDTAAVKAWVDDHSEETTTHKRNPDLGLGRRGGGGGDGKSVAAGRDLYAERHKKKTTT